MRWFMSLLAVLVLIEAGARICPGMLGGEAHAHASEIIAAVDCHGALAQTQDADADTECTGGAACGTCVLLAGLETPSATGLTSPEADPGHSFAPNPAPSALRLTDPPPPKR